MSVVSSLLALSSFVWTINAYGWSDQYCVDYAGSDWLTKYDGDYAWLGNFLNGKPIYEMIECRDPNNCNMRSILSSPYDYKGVWQLYSSSNPANPECLAATESPDQCGNNWWGGRSPVIRACGNPIIASPMDDVHVGDIGSSAGDSVQAAIGGPIDPIGWNDKYCVNYGGLDWLTAYDGDYEFRGMKNGKPMYEMTECRDPNRCYSGSILSIPYDYKGVWQIYWSGYPNGNPECFDETEWPEQCNDWWGGRSPVIEACGDTIIM
jgi:hypothetical protein